VTPYVNPSLPENLNIGLASPIIAFGGGSEVAGIQVLNPGTWYTAGTLAISGGGGSGGMAHGLLDQFGRFLSTVIDNPGSDYSGVPNVLATAAQSAPPLFQAVDGDIYTAGTFWSYGGAVYECVQTYQYGLHFNNASPAGAPSAWWVSTGLSSTPVVATFLADLTQSSADQIVTDGFAAIAVGDQVTSLVDEISGTGVFENNLFNTPYGNGYIYLKSVNCALLNNPNNNNFWQLETSGGAALMKFGAINGPTLLKSINDANLKLDATLTWRLNAITHNGTVWAATDFVWTYSTQ
jgi:hypothetical protein